MITSLMCWDGDEMSRICPICGRTVNAGMTDEDWSFFVHDGECFETYMDRQFGKHKWMELGKDATDEFGGYYLLSTDHNEQGFCGSGIYYTEWED